MNKILWHLIIGVALMCSCKNPKASASNKEQETLVATLLDSLNKVKLPIQSKDPGKLQFTIEFKVKAKGEDLKGFEEGFIPWINIEHSEKDLADLINANQIVLPYERVSLLIDYPIKHPDTSIITTGKAGFTRKQLIELISKRYHQIYKEEEEGAKTKTLPVEKRDILNRNETDGKYGICCHDLSDLDLDSIDVYETSNGSILITLDVES